MKIKHIVLGLGIVTTSLAFGTGAVHSSNIEGVERPINEGTPVVKAYETWESDNWNLTWNNKEKVNHLYGYDEYIIQRSLDFGLNPSFVSALIMNETAWGTSNAVAKQNNPGGIIDPKTYQLKSYDSLYEGIDETIQLLDSLITTNEIEYVQELGKYYAPDNQHPFGYNTDWTVNIFEITKQFGGFDGSLKQ